MHEEILSLLLFSQKKGFMTIQLCGPPFPDDTATRRVETNGHIVSTEVSLTVCINYIGHVLKHYVQHR